MFTKLAQPSPPTPLLGINKVIVKMLFIFSLSCSMFILKQTSGTLLLQLLSGLLSCVSDPKTLTNKKPQAKDFAFQNMISVDDCNFSKIMMENSVENSHFWSGGVELLYVLYVRVSFPQRVHSEGSALQISAVEHK
jgi:hypothetical protein